MRAYLNKNFEKQYSKLPPKIKAQFKDRRDLLLVDPAHTLLNKLGAGLATACCFVV